MTEDERKKREQWVGKHQVVFKEYDMYCKACDKRWKLQTNTNPRKLSCPFCSSNDELEVK